MIIQMRRLSSSAALLPPDARTVVVVVAGGSCVPLPGISTLFTVLNVIAPGWGLAAAALSSSSPAGAVVDVRRDGGGTGSWGTAVVGGASVVSGVVLAVVDEVVEEGSPGGGSCGGRWAKARDGPNHTARKAAAVTTPSTTRRGACRPSPLRLPSSIQSTLWAPAGHQRIRHARIDCRTQPGPA